MSLAEGDPKITHFRARPPLDLPQHTHPLVLRLFKELHQREVSLLEAERRSGLGRNVIGSWRRKHGPSVTNLDAALGAIGLELCIKEKAGHIRVKPTSVAVQPLAPMQAESHEDDA